MAWLKVNMLVHLPEKSETLREISHTLMAEVIESADIFRSSVLPERAD